MAGLSARPIGVAAAAARRAAGHTNSKSNGSTSKASHRQETSKKPARPPQGPEPIGRAARASEAMKRLLRTMGRNGPAARCDGPEAEYSRQDRSQAIPSHCVLQMVIGQGGHELSGLR